MTRNLTEKQKVVIALKIARDLNLNHYHRGHYAADAEGAWCSPGNRRAERWCAHGATDRASEYLRIDCSTLDDLLLAIHAELDEPKGSLPSSLNDLYPERLPELWDRAIALAESEAAA